MKALSTLLILSLVSTHVLAYRGGSGTVGPGNPSALFCEDVGGQSFVVTEARGNQFSLCALGESLIETFSLYNHLHGQRPQVAVQTLLTSPSVTSTPRTQASAEQNCIENQGRIEVVTYREQRFTLCRFSDNSMIEVGTLHSGPESSKNRQLMKLLKEYTP